MNNVVPSLLQSTQVLRAAHERILEGFDAGDLKAYGAAARVSDALLNTSNAVGEASNQVYYAAKSDDDYARSDRLSDASYAIRDQAMRMRAERGPMAFSEGWLTALHEPRALIGEALEAMTSVPR